MIITKLNGGLGNQMFEYAHARNLQILNKDKMFLDIEGFKRSDRHFSLDAFYLNEDVAFLPEKDSSRLILCQATSKINRKLASAFFRVFRIYLWKSCYYKNFSIGRTTRGKYYFYGYWQSEKYFIENRDIIKKELKVKTDILPESKAYLSDVLKENSVCVHIRRGDYVSCNMIACDESYYLKGMDYIHDYHNDCNFLIFSDDIEWVKSNIRFKYPVTYVNLADPDYEVLRLMYLCKHFVMSNSSFSWWAQYLSENKNKIVIAPRVWYPDGHGDASIYMENWIVF